MEEQEHVTQQAHDGVALFLMGSSEADAAVEQIKEQNGAGVVTEWRGVYWAIHSPNRIDVDMRDLSERVGRDLEISDFLVVLSSFSGRIVIGENSFSVVSEISPKD